MSHDLTSTACPACGADLTEPASVGMGPYDTGHFEASTDTVPEETGEWDAFVFLFDGPPSEAYLHEPKWVPDARCVACGASIEGTYEIFSG